MITLGTNLEIELQKRNMTQAQLAERSGLTPAAISMLISGDREPILSTFLKLCVALGLTPNDLLDFHSGRSKELRRKISTLENRLRHIELLCRPLERK